MSSQEAEELAAKLTRVWGQLGPFTQEGEKEFIGSMFPGIVIEVRIIHSGIFFKMWRNSINHEESFQLRAWSTGTLHTGNRQACAPYLDIFRRNCFLSGASIEATAHEQLEWTLWLDELDVAPVPALCGD